MIHNDCRDCALYSGDCGHHFVDHYLHVNYNIPNESHMDGCFPGDHGDCFVPSERYKKETTEQTIKDIVDTYGEDALRGALKYLEDQKGVPG